MANGFKWVNFYMEFADKLLDFKDNRPALISKIREVYAKGGMRLPKLESDNNPTDIDPFTVFGLFNKGITAGNRIKIMKSIALVFDVKADIPDAFEGIPFLNNLNPLFYCFKEHRSFNDINNLWTLFKTALDYSEDESDENRVAFMRIYDTVLKQNGIRWNITMGLYWIRPYTFLNLDSRNRWFMSNPNNMENMPVEFVTKVTPMFKNVPLAKEYLEITKLCQKALDTGEYGYHTFPELSSRAWIVSEEDNKREREEKERKEKNLSNASHIRWMRPIVQALRDLGGSGTPKEVRKKIIENENLSPEEIKVKRGKNNVNKFENEVAFARNDLAVNGYIDRNKRGVWTLTKAGRNVDITDEMASDLFKKTIAVSTAKKTSEGEVYKEDKKTLYPPYTVDDFLNEVYMDKNAYDSIVAVLKNKKNIILQGPPGVGKTFVAERLAFSVMGKKDNKRLMTVQFHQSYSYEDFMMGFRPTAKGFTLQKGPFYNFCKKAEKDKENDYFFIIDEINRGNLSKILGELFMLVENDKRGVQLKLLYTDEKFAVPENVFIIGMMNTADRSLAILDYALRRRFAFIDIKPAFDSVGFCSYKAAVNSKKLDSLVRCVKNLNKVIAEDESLGEGFCIGHSYFCHLLKDTADSALSGIVEYELLPLIKEYWFDEPGKVKQWSENLREAIK